MIKYRFLIVFSYSRIETLRRVYCFCFGSICNSCNTVRAKGFMPGDMLTLIVVSIAMYKTIKMKLTCHGLIYKPLTTTWN